MAVAAASTGTAEVAKGLIDAEAIELSTRFFFGGKATFSTRFRKVRARLERASEMRDLAGVGGSPGEGPQFRGVEKKGRGETN